jgi:CO/xanthine dehydrogenase Mo-binding subunit
MTGGAVKAACEAVRDRIVLLASDRLGLDPGALRLAHGAVLQHSSTGRRGRANQSPRSRGSENPPLAFADLLGDEVIEETRVYRTPRTSQLNTGGGAGNVHLAFSFAAHRAVVDVDMELGVARVVGSQLLRTWAERSILEPLRGK